MSKETKSKMDSKFTIKGIFKATPSASHIKAIEYKADSELTIKRFIMANHLASYTEAVVKIINKPIEHITFFNTDFGVYAYGGRSNEDNSYLDILKVKEIQGYPYQTSKGERSLCDGDWAINEICTALLTSNVNRIDFTGSKFYPGSHSALAKLKGNPQIQSITFKNCTFYNTDTQFFINEFSNTEILINIDNTTKIYQKGDNLGKAGNSYKFTIDNFDIFLPHEEDNVVIMGNTDETTDSSECVIL